MKTHTNLFGILLLFVLFPITSFAQVYNYVVTPDYVREGRGLSVTYDENSDRTLFTGVFEDSLYWGGTSFGENREGFYVGSFDNPTSARILFSIRFPAFVSSYISSTFLQVDEQSNIYLAGVLSNDLANFPLPVEWGDSTIMFGPNTPHPNPNGIPFITKLAPDGRHIWTKFGEEGFFLGFVRDHEGNFIFISYNNTALSYGHPVDSTIFVKHYLTKLDPLGNYLWGRSITGDSGNPFGLTNLGLTIDQTNKIYVSFRSRPENSSLILEGIFYDSLLLPVVQQGNSGILMKFQTDGSLGMVRYAHADEGAGGGSIQTDENNNVFWLGGFRGANFSLSGFNPSAPVSGNSSFIAKYDSLGALVWVEYADSSSFSNSISGNSLLYAGNGNLYMTGTYVGNPTFGSYRFPNRPQGPSRFLTKLLPNRDLAWVHLDKLFFGDGFIGSSIPIFPDAVLPNGEFLSTGHIKQATSFDNILVAPMFLRDYPVITSFIDTSFNLN